MRMTKKNTRLLYTSEGSPVTMLVCLRLQRSRKVFTMIESTQVEISHPETNSSLQIKAMVIVNGSKTLIFLSLLIEVIATSCTLQEETMIIKK